MAIRLNKVTQNLNVGLDTIVDFLKKKGVEVEANPNTKIEDNEYDLLLKEFSKDKALKQAEEERLQARQEKKKTSAKKESPVSETVETVIPKDAVPQFKVVGSIDLDAPRKPQKQETKAPEESAETVAMPPVSEEQKKEPVKQTAETPQVQAQESKQPEQPVIEEKTIPSKEVAEASSEQTPQTSEGVFKIHSNAPTVGPTVVGRIDLDAINQDTRPKRKSKDERRKEREEKEKQRQEQRKQFKDSLLKDIRKEEKEGGSDEAQKKKRNRIGKEKVDIDAAGQMAGSGKPHRNDRKAGHQGQGHTKGQGKDKFRKNAPKQEVSDEDVAKQVKETLAMLTNKGKSKASKYRKEKRETIQSRQLEQEELEQQESKTLKLTEFVTASELANMMNISVTQVISTCMSVGIMVSINQRLDAEAINLVAEEFGYKTEYVSAEVSQAVVEEEDAEEDLRPRAPIVTVMGHVDHGKTSLLDYIRNANVIAGEAGGITQHIGAYNVKLDDGRRITFLDTPGHEAFTAMRARGAKATDVAIIIVAADDSVMPQTKEAINHAMAANVPIVFAINKVDKPNANPDKIKEELSAMNFLVEEWGGKYQSQDISAKKGTGVQELLEKVLLEAEMLELRANPDRKATGSIIESSLDKGRGYVATVLVSNGTLRVGDIVLSGTSYGKVKAMFNERNQRLKQAGPSEPVLILGLNGAPAAGNTFHVFDTDQEAREIANKREQLQREQGLRTQKMLTLDEVGRRLALGDFHELNIIVKGDVDGSVEALSDSLIKLSTEQIQVNVIHKGVGQISESDVSLASASNAIIVGFQVRPSTNAAKQAEQDGVDIRKYSIIYDAIEEVKAAMEGLLAPTLKEQVTATIEVREVFNISKVGQVAGAMVKTGKVKRSDKARLIRDGIVVFSGNINALKRFKDDVKEVGTNFECGISLTNCNDLKVGDIIETYEEIEVKQTL